MAEGTMVLAVDQSFEISFLVARVSGSGREADLASARAMGWPLEFRGTWRLDEQDLVMEASECNGKRLDEPMPLPVFLSRNGDIEYVAPCDGVWFRRIPE